MLRHALFLPARSPSRPPPKAARPGPATILPNHPLQLQQHHPPLRSRHCSLRSALSVDPPVNPFPHSSLPPAIHKSVHLFISPFIPSIHQASSCNQVWSPEPIYRTCVIRPAIEALSIILRISISLSISPSLSLALRLCQYPQASSALNLFNLTQ